MSLQLISQYQARLERIVRYSGSHNESSVRIAFQELLDRYAAAKNLILIPELDYRTSLGTTVRPDGTLKNAVRQDVGYWESKDERDDLEAEIAVKLAKGYPQDNILFEDTRKAVLIQNGLEVGRAKLDDAATLHALLEQFVSFEIPFVRTFREAIVRFQNELPDLLVYLREVIDAQAVVNDKFREKQIRLLGAIRKAINPHLVEADVREMLIQHLLTEEIFTSVFNDVQFHRENNVARELASVTETFFFGSLKRNTRERIRPYYAVIQQAAVNIVNHHEKQQFLKVVYETFYKAYNPAGADRLGIVYTPNEIVRFMVEAADHLTEKHFGKLLGDPGVVILDPATGTGTFITEIIEYLTPTQLRHKYRHELFCNEVALLPYYTANLNIEYTYLQKMGEYAEFENIALVDTLDNLDYVGATGQFGMFELTAENLERIRRQNAQKISVIIGNPPYNANQLNENDNNKNRPYPAIDDRIKKTYVKESTAQKTKVYDMYARFLRWAGDRLGENGVVAYIINRSFIDSRTFDGFRKVVAEEFSEIYVMDLGGDVRANPKLSGTRNNVFGIQTGVAMLFLIRKPNGGRARIFYARRPEMDTAKEKLEYLRNTPFQQIPFEHVVPDKLNSWINQSVSNWDAFLPVATKETKFAKSQGEEQAIFKLFSLGVITARDEWVYGDEEQEIKQRVEFFVDIYNSDRKKFLPKLIREELTKQDVADSVTYSVKWTRAVKNDLLRGKSYKYKPEDVTESLHRPFVRKKLYFNKELNEMQYQMDAIFPSHKAQNTLIAMNVGPSPFNVLASKYLVDYHFNGDSQCLPLYRYDKSGNRLENITDWGLSQFRTRYTDESITKTDIFNYVYAVLHNPAYRKTYELNLRREFPRVPFYDDFTQWAAWGERLLKLHLDFETVEPYPLTRVDLPNVTNPKAKLKADKGAGEIVLDTQTSLLGVPAAAWAYKLGNRSGLEWVLERYRERTPKDKTVAERFCTYRFADHKEAVVTLLGRVCRVGVETTEIADEMTGEMAAEVPGSE